MFGVSIFKYEYSWYREFQEFENHQPFAAGRRRVRRFHSYGPVDCRKHFRVERKEMIHDCLKSLVDDPDDHGQYCTIWAPRQTGKTWLTWQVKKEIDSRYTENS